MNAPTPGQNDGWQQGQEPQYGPPQQPPYAKSQYGQPHYGQQYQQLGYGQPGMQPTQFGNVTQNLSLNFWLSAFFSWLPALIFFLIDKDKVPAVTRSYAAANLNFQLLRTLVTFGVWLVGVIFIVVIGHSVAPLILVALWLLVLAGSVYLFVLQVMAAVKAEDCARRGAPAANLYPFNLHLVS